METHEVDYGIRTRGHDWKLKMSFIFLRKSNKTTLRPIRYDEASSAVRWSQSFMTRTLAVNKSFVIIYVNILHGI